MCLKNSDSKKTAFPLVSIIITCYNYGRYLPESIESAINQVYPNIEIIVIDDGSEDSTKEIVSRYPVTYVRQPRQGVAAARNNGIKLSQGEFFICLDADDKLLPNYVTKTVNSILKDPKIGFVVTGSIFWNEMRNIETVWIPDKIYNAYSLHTGWRGALGCALIRRKAFNSLEYGYDCNLPAYEDLDVCFRLLLKGWRAVTIFEPLHLYRIHADSLNPKSPFQRKYAEDIICTKYPFRRLYRKMHTLYANTFGRIKSLMSHPILYLQGVKKKIIINSWTKSFNKVASPQREEILDIASEIFKNIDFLLKCYQNKYLREHYTQQLKILEIRLQKELKSVI